MFVHLKIHNILIHVSSSLRKSNVLCHYIHIEGQLKLYYCPLMIDTVNQSSKYIISVVIARDHESEKKEAVAVEWGELQDEWRERTASDTILGGKGEWHLPGTESLPDSCWISPLLIFMASKWLDGYNSHFSEETKCWSGSSIVIWLFQRWACTWSHAPPSGSYMKVLFSLLLLWLCLAYSDVS